MTNLDRDVETRLRQHRMRYTDARRRVVACLSGSDGPRSAAELLELLGGAIPMSSLYRSLMVLEETGILVPHHGARGVTRYELAEWLTGHHHHLVCIDCGAVDDIDVPKEIEHRVEDLVDTIGSISEFRPTGHVLEIEGRCARCA